ncbi:uncharacterized protein STEHIDRAFT_165624 [Stereum hirsutum FP-91666 SS1]|uniref:uncharacterized protein n=1 Tax=Stereum hirsutum (strain FP-91666) TaxID=721885 RepID=UPI000440EACD|nr:uncharacterized protein STEHIDRAFT_165624 [Stereum hirsutum FP-91666 SS1]EIM91278.1 hypothetical protein STEHIDRAFT_165624 [Stereum hirsutum FP-91666 SS1]
MKSVIFATALFVAAASAQFTVNTPSNVVECQPLQIVWTGGSGDTYLSVLPGDDPTGTAVVDFGQQTSPYTWTAVNVTSGTSLGITVRDSTGALAQTAAFTVNSGSDSSCLTSSGSSTTASAASSASGSSSSSSTASASSTSAAATSSSVSSASSSSSASAASGSSSASKSTGSSSSGSSTATSAASSSSSSSAAAPTLAAQYGAAGVLGALAAAVLL